MSPRSSMGFDSGKQWSYGADASEVWKTAYENLIRAQRRVAHRYNSKREPHQYKVGNTVLYRLNLVSSKAQKVSAKLLLKWSRPMTIAKFVRPNVVLLANPETGVIVRRAHVSQLKAFRN